VHGEQLDAPPTLEPGVSIQLDGQAGGRRATIDLLVEVDRTGRGASNATKLTAYDHFLGGWCLRTRHWGTERRTRPVVVFVVHSPGRSSPPTRRRRRHGALGVGGRGRYEPTHFEFPGRAHAGFTCLDWLLAGQALALRLPPMPAQVRGQHSDLRPGRAALLPEAWRPA
jgi:hypothetical protein